MPPIRRFLDSSRTVPLWTHGILIGILAIGFYVYIRSFPLMAEDGAFNYMSLIQRLNTEHPFSLLFGFKLIEGLGQPNPFLTIAFDPFSWPLLVVRFGHESRQNYLFAFQLTMALRVIACWLGTYIFASAAFPGTRTVALTASYLNASLSFFLAVNGGGAFNHASMYNASQAALLALAAGVYARGVSHSKSLFSANSLTLFILLFFLILSYPLGSMFSVLVLIAIAVSMAVVGGAVISKSARFHLVGLLAMIGAILFMPGLNAYASWQTFAKVSSRIVFADELQTFFSAYGPPRYWYAPPIASRLIALCAVASLLVIDRVPPIARATIAAAVLIVGGIQLLYLVLSWKAFAYLVRSLPPLDRIETFIPLLYAFPAALALYGAERLLIANRGWRFLLWSAAALVLLGSVVYMFDIAYDGFLTDWGAPRTVTSGVVLALVATTLAVAFACNALRSLAPRFLPGSLRRPMGAIEAGHGLGEAARAALCYGFVVVVVVYAARMWMIQSPFIAGFLSREMLCNRLTVFGCQDTNFGRDALAGENPVVDFLRDKLSSSELFAGRAEYLSPYNADWPIIANLSVEEKTNFLDSSNGMLLGALSFQDIPVLSTYEQSHDYLFYLFWTRYLTQNVHVRYFPNWLGLYQFRPGPLELAGVRYVVTRRENQQALGATPIVFKWRDYVVAELRGANTGGYGVTHVHTAPTLAGALSLMRRPDFDPRTDAVLSETDRRRLPESGLQPVESSEIATRRQIVHLAAQSAGKASLIVLPFRYSHCWQARWNGPAGTLVRVDAALLAVYFEGTVDATLEWTGGYGASARCLEEDASLIEEARAAAKQLPN